MFKIDLHLLDEKLSHLPWKDSRRDYMRQSTECAYNVLQS